MLCCCERDEQTSSRIMSDYNIDLREWGVSSVPALMAKIVAKKVFRPLFHILYPIQNHWNYLAPVKF